MPSSLAQDVSVIRPANVRLSHFFSSLPLLAVSAVAFGLARRYPQGITDWLAQIHWPSLHGAWMNLAQLVYLAFLLAFIALSVQYLRKPMPLHAAQSVGLCGLLWMLPQVFILTNALQVMISMVMLMLVAARPRPTRWPSATSLPGCWVGGRSTSACSAWGAIM